MIDSFKGDFAFMSNFYPSPVRFENKDYPTVEHAFQSSKTTDYSARTVIRLACSPGEAKRLGRKVELRPDWEILKRDIMYALLTRKFVYEPLKSRLLETGLETLVEGNTWHDNLWGDCRCDCCSTFTGANMLGELLEEVRADMAF